MADIFRQWFDATGYSEEQLSAPAKLDTFSFGLTNALRGLTSYGSQIANRLGMDLPQAALDEWSFNLGEEAKEQFNALPIETQSEINRPLTSTSGVSGVLANLWTKGLASLPSMLAAAGAGVAGGVVGGPPGAAVGLGTMTGALTGGELTTTVDDYLNALDIDEPTRQSLKEQAYSTGADLIAGGLGALFGLAGPEAIATLGPVRSAIGALNLPGRVGAGTVIAGTGEAAQGAVPPATTNLASEAAPEIGIPEQSVVQGAIEEGALGAVTGGAVSTVARPYTKVEPGQTDEAENLALSETPLPQPELLALPPPGGPIMQPGRTEPLLALPAPEPTGPVRGGPVVTPDVIPQPGRTEPQTLLPPGGMRMPDESIPEAAPGADPLVQPMATRWALIDAGFQPAEIDTWDHDEAVEAIVAVQRERLTEQGVLNPGEIEDAVAELRQQVEAGITVDDSAFYRQAQPAPTVDELRVVPEGAPPANVTPELQSEPVVEAVPTTLPPPVEGPAPGQGAPRRVRPRPAPIPLPPETEVSEAPPISMPEVEDLRVIPEGQPAAPLPDRQRTIQEIFSPTEGATRQVSPEPIAYTPEGARILEAAPTLYDQELEARSRGTDTEEEAGDRRQIEKDYPQYAGRTDLSTAEIVRRVQQDPARAAEVLEANQPTGEGDDAIGTLMRLETILEQANAQDIAYPGDPNNPNGRVGKTVPDTILWLADAARTVRALTKNLNNVDALLQYQANEAAAQAGDFEPMRATFGATSAGRSGGTVDYGGGIEDISLVGQGTALNEEEAASRERAVEEGETVEEPVFTKQEAPSSSRPITAYQEYIWVTDEETGVTKRIKNPVARGVTVEASPEEQARIIEEVAPRAAELRASRDKQFPTREKSNLKGGKARQQGQGGRGASTTVVARAITPEAAAEAGVELRHPRKTAEAIAKSKAKEAKKDQAALKKVVTAAKAKAKEEPAPQAEAKEAPPKRPTKKAEREVAKAQRAERKAGVVPKWKPNETFEERRARIFAEIEAARNPKSEAAREAVRDEANITAAVTLPDGGKPKRPSRVRKGAASWVSWTNPEEPTYTREQSDEARHTAGAKEIGDYWYKPSDETTLGNILDKVANADEDAANLPKGFVALAKAVAERIRATGDTDMEVLYLPDDQFDHIMTSGDGKTTWNAAFWVDENQPQRILIRDSLPADALQHIHLHEAIHTATSLELHASSTLRGVLHDVMVETGQSLEGTGMTDPWSEYGMTDVHEFLAEAFSNPRFQQLLRETRISKGLARRLGIDNWRRATGWQAIVAFVRKVLGLGRDVSALEAAMSFFDRITLNRDDTMLGEYMRGLAAPVSRIEDAFVTAGVRVDEWERGKLTQPRRAHGAEQAVRYKAVNDEVASRSAMNIAYKLRDEAGDRASWLGQKSLYLRSRDSLMRSYENLFPEGGLRRFVNALARRDTLAQELHATDAKMLRAKEQLFDKYRDKKIGSVSAQEVYETSRLDQTNWQIDASIPLERNTWLYSKGKLTKEGVVAAQHYPALKKAYDSLPSDMQAMLKREFKWGKDKRQRAIDGVLTNWVLTSAKQPMTPAAALKLGKRVAEGNATNADVALIGQVAHDRIRETAEFRGLPGPYSPMSRFGNYVVSAIAKVAAPTSGQWRKVTSPQSYIVDFYGDDAEAQAAKYAGSLGKDLYAELSPVWTDAQGRHGDVMTAKDVVNGAQKGTRVTVQNKHVEFFETEREAKDAAADLAKDSFYESVKPVHLMEDTGETFEQASAGSRQLKSIMDELNERDAFAGLPPKVKKAAQQAVHQAIFRAAPGTSISKRRMQRKHVMGASRDSLRVAQVYSHSMNNYIAGIETAHEIHESYLPLAESVRNDYSSAPVRASAVLNELSRRRNQRAGTYDASGPVVNALTSWQFIDKLASPAYSIINMTQPAMITLPVLSAKYGIFNASRAMTKAAKDIGYFEILGKGMGETFHPIRTRLEGATSFHEFVTKGNRRLGSNQVKMLDKLVEYGALDPDAGFEAARVQNKGAVSSILKTVEDIFRSFPRAVEANNRYLTALAAYELATKKGKSHDAATEAARDAVEQTQFNYSASNASPIFNNPLGRVALQFMKYGAFMYQLLGSQVYTALSSKTKGPERVEAIKGLTYLIAAHVVMSGFGGLPLEPLRLLVTGLDAAGVPIEWEDVEMYVRDVASNMVGADAGEALTRGLPRWLGMDLSTRISLGDLLVPRPQVDFSERGGLEAYLFQFAGATMGGVTDLFEGTRDVMDGNYMQGVEKAIPIKLFTDVSAAVRMGTTGKLSQARDPVLTYDPLDMFYRAVGIRPRDEAQTSERRAASARLTERYAQSRERLLLDFYSATPDQRAKFGPRFKAFNEGLPRSKQLNFNEARQYVRDKTKRQRGSVGTIIPRRKDDQRALEELLETYPE